MKQTNKLFLFLSLSPALCLLLVAGCATSSSRLNRVQLGMSRHQLVSVLGKPHNVSAQGDTEYLSYFMVNTGMGDRREYAVRLINGKVESFAEKTDYGPTRFATQPAATKTATNTPVAGLPGAIPSAATTNAPTQKK